MPDPMLCISLRAEQCLVYKRRLVTVCWMNELHRDQNILYGSGEKHHKVSITLTFPV